MATRARETPVLIGAGQVLDAIEAEDYRRASPVELAAIALRRALESTGADAATVAAAIGTVAGVRQFEQSHPLATAPFGRSNNFPRSVAQRVGVSPRRAILEVVGGQSPEHLVHELGQELATGATQGVVAIVGAEAISSLRHLAGTAQQPDWSETIDGSLEDRGFGLEGIEHPLLSAHGLGAMTAQYALFETARRLRLGLGRPAYAHAMAELFAPMSATAAQNPYAASRTARSVAELETPSAANRYIAEPHTRYLVARDQVNQGAAVLLSTAGSAQALGIDPARFVYLHGRADATELALLERPDLSVSPAARAAMEAALSRAAWDLDEVDAFDLYSCFPIAVSNVAEYLGLEAQDPRGLTLCGGLPYFGGPGNNYSLHAIAEAVERCREDRSARVVVGANGGALSKYSVGCYSGQEAPWPQDPSIELAQRLGSAPRVELEPQPNGHGTVESATVLHGREALRGAVVGRLPDGRRFVASVAGDELLGTLREGELRGLEVRLSSSDGRTIAT